MKVYALVYALVVFSVDEPVLISGVDGIYSTREKALEVAKKLTKFEEWDIYEYTIDE